MNDGPLAGLRGGGIRLPDSLINVGSSPLPTIPSVPAFTSADGRYNAVSSLLPGGLQSPYAYGTSARISTQTQQAHPNRVALIIAKLYLPSPESDGTIPEDPVLQHALSDGDLAFTLRMPAQMVAYGSQYCVAPYGFAAKAVPLVNLATLNYLLWGLQVGFTGAKSVRWRDFFRTLIKEGINPNDFVLRDNNSDWRRRAEVEQRVWNFLKTYFCLFGVQHGGDQQGGMHETEGSSSLVTHGAVDYVSSYAVEGKLRHINNYWRDSDVHENDDLILALRYKEVPHPDLNFVLSSSSRFTRNERVSLRDGFFFLRPEVLQHRSFTDVPYVHVARAMNYCGSYTRGLDACCWDARMPVVPGAPLHGTFEPGFMDSDRMFYRSWELYRGRDENEDEDPLALNEEDDDDDGTVLATTTTTTTSTQEALLMAVDRGPVPPSHILSSSTTTTTAAANKRANKPVISDQLRASADATIAPKRPRVAGPAAGIFSGMLAAASGGGGGAAAP